MIKYWTPKDVCNEAEWKCWIEPLNIYKNQRALIQNIFVYIFIKYIKWK